MLPMKQAINKPSGQNLFGERGWSSPLSFVAVKTRAQNNRLQT